MPRITQRLAALFTCLVFAACLIAARPLPIPPVVAERSRALVAPLPAVAAPNAAVRMAGSSGTGIVAGSLAHTPGGTLSKRPLARLHQALGTLPAALAALPVVPLRIPGDGPAMPGTLVAQTQRLDLYVGLNTFSQEQIRELAPHFEQLLREDEERFGTRLTHRVSVAFYRPSLAPERGVRGMAYTDASRAELFYAPGEDIGRASVVFAHELGHHLEAQRYGDAVQRRADTVLHEGLATWITGEPWLTQCGATSWRQRARELRDAGIPLRLHTAEAYGANKAYELWASFVDFLVEDYGWDTFDALYRSGRGRATGSSDYQGVTGKSLDELADEWRAWVNE